jgi:hypothetical protein
MAGIRKKKSTADVVSKPNTADPKSTAAPEFEGEEEY